MKIYFLLVFRNILFTYSWVWESLSWISHLKTVWYFSNFSVIIRVWSACSLYLCLRLQVHLVVVKCLFCPFSSVPLWVENKFWVLNCIQWKLKADEEDQDRPPQNVPFWHNDYFKQKAIENQQIPEEISAFRYLPKVGQISLCEGVPSFPQLGRKEWLITWDGELTLRWVCINRPN